MFLFKKRIRPLWIVLFLLALAAIVWATNNESGQANALAANAGESSKNAEMASLDTIKPSKKAPNVDWKKEQQIRKDLEAQDKAYTPLVEKAKGEAAAGAVSEPTRGQLLVAAKKFKDTSYTYAEVWEKGKCISRAKLAREVGDTRVASADLIAYGANSEKADALKARQASMNEARNLYAKEAKANDELSPADKAAIKSSVMPRAQKLMGETSNLVTQVTSLLSQIKSQASPGGLVRGLAGGGGGPAALLSHVQSLLSLAQGLASNAKSLMADATLLSE